MDKIYALSNKELHTAIAQAGHIVMQQTDKSTSGEARQHAANHLKRLFEVQYQRCLVLIPPTTEKNNGST